MTDVPIVHNWLAGDEMNALRMNEIADQINFMRNPPACWVRRRNATQSITGGGTWAKITFDTVVYDPYGFFTVGTPDQLIVTVPGWYSVEMVTSWTGTANDTRLLQGVYKNGTVLADNLILRYDQQSTPNSGGGGNIRRESQLFFNQGDTVYLMVAVDLSGSYSMAATSDAECAQLRLKWVSN